MLVADTHLFRSADRGVTWTERALPTGAGQIEVALISELNGFAMRVGAAATQCQAQSVTTFRTTDGATTWQPVGASFDTAQCRTSLAYERRRRHVARRAAPRSAGLHNAEHRFPSAGSGRRFQHGAVREPRVGLSGSSDKRYVFRSTDAGATRRPGPSLRAGPRCRPEDETRRSSRGQRQGVGRAAARSPRSFRGHCSSFASVLPRRSLPLQPSCRANEQEADWSPRRVASSENAGRFQDECA